MTARTLRTGFTLVEMLLVLTIMVVIASIAAVVTLRMQSRDQVPRAATMVQGALATAKARAIAERQNHGIRLTLRLNKAEMTTVTDTDGDGHITLADLQNATNTPARIKDVNQNGFIDYEDVLYGPGNPPTGGGLADSTDNEGNGYVDDLVLSDQVELIRDPGDFTDGNATGTNGNSSVTINLPTYNFIKNFVIAGDWIEFNGQGQLFQIAAVDQNNNTLTLNRGLDFDITNGPYRIIRQPRLVPGEKPIQLAGGVVIDLKNTKIPLSSLGTIDIVFSPGGSVVGEAGASDLLFIWLRDATFGSADNEALVTVYAKTGGIMVYPVDSTSGDMYKFARTGRASNSQP